MKPENTIIDTAVCQSCGMPMMAVEHFGTNNDNSQNKEFCCFCFQNGRYTDNFDFEEFLNDSLKFYEGDKTSEHTLTRDEVALKERIKLSELRRWHSHQRTHLEYYKSINKVVDYINNSLSANMNLSDLANVANISDFHFHRIFKAVLNESPGDYIQRLRLEKAAFKLQTTKLSLEDIAEHTGYQSAQALSKAFKKRYNITPSVFRKRPDDLTTPIEQPVENLYLKPEIKKTEAKDVFYLQVTNPYTTSDAFLNTWDRLVNLIGTNVTPNDEYEFFCLSRDISTITRPENYRVYACISTNKDIKPHGRLGKQTIEGGLYAVFTHKGPYKELRTTYCNIYRYWIPKSDYELRDNILFEKYLNSPLLVGNNDLLAEIYIPVRKI